MSKLKINSVTYAIEKHQSDASLPYLFMLHGFMGDGRTFHHMTDHLCNACNPVTVDLLGHGKSEKVHHSDRYGEERQVDDIMEVVKQTISINSNGCIADSTSHTGTKNAGGAGTASGDTPDTKAKQGEDTSAGTNPPPPYLYGYSMGGRLALKTALKAPEQFAGLILESTNYGITGEAERTGRRKADARRARQIEQDYPAFLAEWEKLPLFRSPEKTDKELENKYSDIHLSQNPQAMAASLEGFGTGAMQPVANPITHFNNPVMIVAGTGDEKYMKIGQSLAGCFSDARFCPIPAGHRVHLNNPAALTEKLIPFINQNSTL